MSETTTRRSVLRVGLQSAGLLALAPARRLAAAAPATPPPALVVIELRGGNDGLNTLVPTQLRNYAARRGSLALAPAQCLGIEGTNAYRLHPALPRLRDLWQRGEVAAIHKVGYPGPNRSHFKSLDVVEEGVRNGFGPLGIARSGWVARYADRHANHPFGAIEVGLGRAVATAGGSTRLLHLHRLENYFVKNDPASWTSHLHRLRTVQTMLGRSAPLLPGGRLAVQGAHAIVPAIQQSLAAYPGDLSRYPATALGHALKDVAVLHHSGAGTRIFYTGVDGFDTHALQGAVQGRHADMLQQLDDALHAFVEDQRTLGAWQGLVVAVVSEFGRRIAPNASNGSEHGAASTWFVLGGPVRGGLYGTGLTEQELLAEQLDYATDFRDIYEELLARHLGVVATAEVFPERWSGAGALGLLG